MKSSASKKHCSLKRAEKIIRKTALFLVLSTLIITLILVAVNINAIIGGLFGKNLIYSQHVSIATEQSGEFPISLDKHPENFELSSFKISGTTKGTGIVKVYLQNRDGEKLLVLDSTEFNKLTGKIIEDLNNSKEINISLLKENVTVPELIPEENISSPEENATTNINETKPDIIEDVLMTPVSFRSIGIDTSNIKTNGFNEVKLVVIIEGDAELNIDEIEYSAVDLSMLAIKESSLNPEIYEKLSEEGSVRIIVNLKDTKGKGMQASEKKASVISSLNTNEIDKGGEFELGHKYKNLNAISGEVTAEGLAKLLENPDVKSIEYDQILNIQLSQSAPLINATEVWKKQINGINITGKGETACILDTGVNKTHPALAGKVINEYCYCSVSGPCCFNGNFTDTSALDDNSHGTHVAGIIASNDAVYRGIAPEANLVSVKVCNSAGSCASSDIIAGIEYCTENALLYNISVISISIGGGSYADYCDSVSQSMTDAINNAVASGIMVSIASGNSGSSSTIAWPACVKNATAVGATNKDDTMWSSSNRNNLVDLAAPGSSIISSILNGFGSKSGTSMATPHVSGAAILLKQYYKAYNGANPSALELERILNNSGKLIYDSSSGLYYSRINVLDAIDSVYKINSSEKSIESAGKAKVVFSSSIGSVDLSSSQFAFNIKNNFIELKPGYSQFDMPANITFYNLSFQKMPVILRDGNVCADCYINSYANGSFSFYVPHFSNYTAGSNSQLSIWNSNGAINENIMLYANYTNRSSGLIITSASCRINFSSSESSMQLNGSLFEYNKSFDSYGDYNYNIICNHTDFENLSAVNTASISKKVSSINLSLNGKNSNLNVLNNSFVNISASIIPAEKNIILIMNGAVINNGASIVSNLTLFTSYGAFNITAYSDETENYSAASSELMLEVINDTIAPKFSNSKNSGILSYSANQSYQFNITCTDNIAIDTVLIEHNFAGITSRYAVNKSNDEYYYSWKDLKAGSFSYTWIANDTSGNSNSSPYSYSVNKRPSQIRLEIEGNEGNVTVKHKEIDIDAELIDPTSGEIYIKKDGTKITDEDSPISTSYNFSSGIYIIKAAYDGNENYSSKEVSSRLNVSLSTTTQTGSGDSEILTIQCTESWTCSPWGSCNNGLTTRNCTDSNNCGTTRLKPSLYQICNCAPKWNCTDWSDCSGGIQARNCIDMNNCNRAQEKPATNQSCELPAMQSIKGFVNRAVSEIKNAALNSINFIKNEPVYAASIIAGISAIIAMIIFRYPAIRFIKRVHIVINEAPKTKRR